MHVPPVEFLQAQLDAVLDDLPVAAVKTGMLATEEVVRAVADVAAAGRLPHLVVDPVLVSSTGARLLDPGAERAYVEALFPHALVVTPNTREAAALLGRAGRHRRPTPRPPPGTWPPRAPRGSWSRAGTSPTTAATRSTSCSTPPRDAVTELRAPRVATANDHGTGCTFAAATAALLAAGADVRRRAGRRPSASSTPAWSRRRAGGSAGGTARSASWGRGASRDDPSGACRYPRVA